MPLDVLTNADNVRVTGNLTVGNDSNGNAGIAKIDTIALTEGIATAQAVATGTAVILIPANQSVVRISAGAATTGASLPAGQVNGQVLIIIITSAAANTVTFAAAGTSLVAGGAATSLAGLAAHMFVYDATGALWYQVGPLAN